MRSLAFLALLAGATLALPQDVACLTTTTQVIVPTTTQTWKSTAVVTERMTGAKDLGTFTLVERVSSTRTLMTLPTTATRCNATGIVVAPVYTTIYTTSGASPSHYKRALGLTPRETEACLVTETSTTSYGITWTYLPATETSTYYKYTSFTQATVTSTKYGGTAYAIATATRTASRAVCGAETVTGTKTATVTQDARCKPSALTSAYNGFGLAYVGDVPASGASWHTVTDSASACCQLCAEADSCAAMAWDSRTGKCALEFPVWFSSGELSCSNGLLAYYNAGPQHPMPPGAGYYVAALCGDVSFGNAKPDDGT